MNLTLSCPSCHKGNNSDTTPNAPHTQTHLLHYCETFSHLREELDIEDDEQVVEFFKKVVESRTEESED